MTDKKIKAKSPKKRTLINKDLYYTFLYAVEANNVGEMKILMVNPNHNLSNLDLTIKSCPVLMTEMAIRKNNKEALDFLLDNGANIHATDPHIGWTLLMYAVSYHNLELAQHLIDRGINVNATNKDGKNAMTMALGKYDMMDLLIDAGINLQHKNEYGRSFLQDWVHADNNWDDIRYLILKGACTDGLYSSYIRFDESFKEFINQAKIDYEKLILEQSMSKDSSHTKKILKI